MNQPHTPPREVTTPEATITGAKLALAGTIVAAIIGATATITVALVQQKNSMPSQATPTPAGNANAPSASTPPSTPAATTATPATPDGVTYRCTGSAPAGVDITYGPSSSGLQATSLPFIAHDDSVSETAQSYRINAQLKGGGDVTCTLTVTAAGHTTTSSGTARGGYNSARPQICTYSQRRWRACG
jgi:hypothetical protein